MRRVGNDRTAPDVLSSETERSIVAHLRGGPFDGREVVLYRARAFYTPRVSRGPVRRALHMSRRYAWYELGRTWEEHDVLHGEYDFLEIRPQGDSFGRRAP